MKAFYFEVTNKYSILDVNKINDMVYNLVFEELADLLASMNPDKVLSFHTSQKSQLRLEKLLEKNKHPQGLSEVEKAEMGQFMILEHIVGLAKAKALKNLAQQ